jgi:hypothetical protein
MCKLSILEASADGERLCAVEALLRRGLGFDLETRLFLTLLVESGFPRGAILNSSLSIRWYIDVSSD